MMRYLKKFTLASLLLTLLLVGSAGGVSADSPAPVYFFWGDGCPHCETQKPFLDELAARYPQVEVHSYEVWYVQENRQIFFDMTAKLGFEPSGVPVTIIGEQYWVGFHETIKGDIEAAVVGCIQNGCPDLGVGIIPDLQPVPVSPAVPADLTEPSPGSKKSR
jgi:thiol-disulfide isomerase/thioredoxin